MTTLKLTDLVKSYSGRRVVKSVSLEVKSGEVVGLLGPNGAGKTTTFYMTIGLVRPDEGKITLDGEDITDFPMYQRARKGVGYLPQETSIFRKLTVKQNIMAILEILPLSGSERKHRADMLLEELGIKHLDFRGVKSAALKFHAPWLPTLHLFCSMSLLPASIRWPSMILKILSITSNDAALAYLSLIIMSERPSVPVTMPTSW